MDATITTIVLFAALLHAVWNALLKSSADCLVELTNLNLSAGFVALAVVPFVGFPAKESFPFLLATLFLHCGYYAFLILSYDRGGLSLVYPIARGGSPVLVALASALFLGEVLNGAQALGVLIITASIAGLAFAGGVRLAFAGGVRLAFAGGVRLAFAGGVTGLSVKAVLFSLGTSVTIAGYTIADGSGVRVSGAPIAYIGWLFVMNAFPLLLVLPFLRAQARINTNSWPPMHPVWLRCKSFRYLDITHSLRLARRAPRRPRIGIYSCLDP